MLHLKAVTADVFVLFCTTIRVSALATCTTLEVTGAGGTLTGTYEFDEDKGNYYRGGASVYTIEKDSSDMWFLVEGTSVSDAKIHGNFPYYFVYDEPANHPVDVTEAWQMGSSISSSDFEAAPSTFSITCAETTASVLASATESTCTTLEVTGAGGTLTGTYEFDEDEDNYYRGGASVYTIEKHSTDMWFLVEGTSVSDAMIHGNFPYYFVYDEPANHPVDVTEEWQMGSSISSSDFEAAPSTFSITCAETTASVLASATESTCTTVYVTDDEGTLTGTYEFDEDEDNYYRGGASIYIIEKHSTDMWFVVEGTSVSNAMIHGNFPYYFVYDEPADHPADVTEEWQMGTSVSSDDYVPAPAAFSVACEGSPSSSSEATPGPARSPTPSPVRRPTPSPARSPTPSPVRSLTPSPSLSPTPNPSPKPTTEPTPIPWSATASPASPLKTMPSSGDDDTAGFDTKAPASGAILPTPAQYPTSGVTTSDDFVISGRDPPSAFSDTSEDDDFMPASSSGDQGSDNLEGSTSTGSSDDTSIMLFLEIIGGTASGLIVLGVTICLRRRLHHESSSRQ